jgi:Arc/MetJ-type ribon-helix-helix transcriptional regulator
MAGKRPPISVSFNDEDCEILDKLRLRVKIYKNTELLRYAVRKALEKENGRK